MTSCELRLKPLSVIDMSLVIHEMDRRLCDVRREVRHMLRRMDMLETNLGIATQAVATWRPDLVPRLHADTPDAWYQGLTEEY